MKTVYFGADHGGFELKTKLLNQLSLTNTILKDVGTLDTSACNYPEIAQKVAQAIQSHKNSFGVLICKSGIGMCITANKFKGIYAACLTTLDTVIKARQHNAINVICLPGTLDSVVAQKLIETFLTTDIDADSRHCKRREQIYAIESKIFIA